MPTHNSLPAFLFSVFLLLLSINSCFTAPINSFTNNGSFTSEIPFAHLLGYQITDLTSKDLATFAFLTQDWSISGLATSTSNSSLCGTNFPLLGGYSIFANNIILEKTYTSLISHSAIKFQINFAFIDKFKNPDFLTLTLSGTSIPGGSPLKTYNFYLTSSLCGGSDPETTQFTLMGSILHTSNLLDLKIVAKVATGANSGTFGIRDINFFLVNDTSITTTNSCFRVYDTHLTGLSGECQCQKGYYYNSGSCLICDSSCGDCFGPSSSQCYSCVSGFFFGGTDCEQCDSSCETCSGLNNNQCLTCQTGLWLQKNGTCMASCSLPSYASQAIGVHQVCETICQDSEYLLWNGTCVTNCPSPLIGSIIDSSLLCNKPCQAGELFDYNGNCISSCPSPYVQGTDNNGVDMCNLPCDPLTEYLYPNGSCSGSCNSPLISSFSSDIQLCNSPCGSDFMYPDDSCNPQCNSPLLASSIMGIQYCNSPCGVNGFIYPNGSCYSQCSPPLVSATESTISWCSSPCTNYLDFYYQNDSTCKSVCQSPNVIENHDLVNVCLMTFALPPVSTTTATTSPLTSEEKNQVDQANSVTKGAGATARATTVASSIVSSRSPNAISLISLMKMLDYVRYMNINYPPKLQYFLDSKGKGSISMSFEVSLPENIKEEFPKKPLPGKFGEYGLSSSFVVDYWEELFTCVIIFIILGFASVMAFYTKKIKYIGRLFFKVKSVIQWNLVLILICSNLDSVGVYSSLELRTTPFDSILSILGTLICVFVNLVALFLMGLSLYVGYSLWRSRKTVSPGLVFQKTDQKETEEKYLNCGVLYLSFRNCSFMQRSCMFFILLRIYLFNVVIGYLFDHPLAQAILIVLMSFLMLAFLSIQRPHKKTFELIKAITFESIIFVVNISILILAIMDHKGVYMKEERVRLGDVIILANTLFHVVVVLFIAIEIVFRVIKAYRISKKIESRGVQFWTKIIVTLFEPEDMEEVTEEQAKNKQKIYCDPVRKEIIQIKSLFEVESRNESHLDLEKSSPLKSTKVSPSISSSQDPINSILSFDGLGDGSSRKNLLQQSMRSGRGSILHNFPEINSTLQKRRFSRFSILNEKTPTSFQEVELIKMASHEASKSGSPKNSSPKGNLVRKFSENLLPIENISSPRELQKRRRIGFGSPSNFSRDHLVNLSFESDPNTPTPTLHIHSAGFSAEVARLSLCSDSSFKPGNKEKRSSP